MTKFFSTVIAAATLCAAGTAQAQDEAPRATIRTADLNLASPAGLATFQGRVKAAADRACGEAPAAPSATRSAVAACRDSMVRSAAARIGKAGPVEVLGTR